MFLNQLGMLSFIGVGGTISSRPGTTDQTTVFKGFGFLKKLKILIMW